MKKKEELGYFDAEWKEMKASLKSYFKEEKQEDLHRFRVQVKKLRAFIFLADSDRDDQKLTKDFKPVKRIFRKAGEIRDAYMHQELVKKMKLDANEIIQHQQQLQKKAARKFEGKKRRFFKKMKNIHQVLRKKIKSVSDTHINLFYQSLLHDSERGMSKLTFKAQLHRCRKLVKMLIYNYKLVHPVVDPGLNEAYLEKVQTAIGDWHDQELAVKFFSGRGKNYKTAAARLKKSGGKLRENVTDLARNFYHRATKSV